MGPEQSGPFAVLFWSKCQNGVYFQSWIANITTVRHKHTTNQETKMKTRTCLRCKGKGMRNTPVVHLGVPGLCYGCDGKGVQVWRTAEQLNKVTDSMYEREFAQLKVEGTQLADAVEFYSLFQSWRPEDPSTPNEKRHARRLRRVLRDATKGRDYLRTRWSSLAAHRRDNKPATKGKWLAS